MDIKYLGHASFRLKGKNAVVVTDPFDKASVGFGFPKVTADIVTVSHEHGDHNAVGEVIPQTESTVPLIIRGAGEYESKGVKVYGSQTYHDAEQGAKRGTNTIYQIIIDGVSILHCGDLGHLLSDKLLDTIDQVHVLLIPVGGVYTINEKEALKVIRQLEPALVIPMHYKAPGMISAFDQLAPLEAFLKEIGKNPAPIAKLSIACDKLPSELEVVVLER